MLRFARLHLQPDEEAEDAVQDASVVLWAQAARLAQADDPQRYVFGVLKNKITDRLRQRYRHSHEELPAEDALDAVLFKENGHWAEGMGPAQVHNPERLMAQGQFLERVDWCVQKLPPKIARVFSMKEFLECEAAEICDVLGLSKADYWQCLSRARKQLQLCLHQQGLENQR